MEYNEARIQALENEVFNLKQENSTLRSEIDYLKRQVITGFINGEK